MAFFQVTAAQLKEKAEELTGLNQKLVTETENLVSAENGLKASWEGEANEAFSREFQRDRVQLDNFTNAVNQYVEALLNIAQKYEEAENRNLSLASSRTY